MKKKSKQNRRPSLLGRLYNMLFGAPRDVEHIWPPKNYSDRSMLVYRVLDKPLAQRGIFLPRHNPNSPISKENFRTFHDEHIVAEKLLIELGINPSNAFFVDVGAGDGIDMSNTYLLAQSGSKGISVELNPSKFGMLAVTYRDFPQVNLARCAATPLNIGDLLRGLGAPKNINFLSLDIDSFDYYVLESILKEFTLDIACLEINPAFPLSVDFSVTYPNSEWRGGLFQGMSLSMAYKLLSTNGYSIVHIDRACLFAIRATSQPVEFPSLTIHQAEEKLIQSLQNEAYWNSWREKIRNKTAGESIDIFRNEFSDLAPNQYVLRNSAIG